MAAINRTLASRAFEHRGAIAADDSPRETVFPQGQPERPAYQTGADNRDLANGHRFRDWDRLLDTKSGNRAADRWRNDAQLIHQFGKLIRVERLRAI